MTWAWHSSAQACSILKSATQTNVYPTYHEYRPSGCNIKWPEQFTGSSSQTLEKIITMFIMHASQSITEAEVSW